MTYHNSFFSQLGYQILLMFLHFTGRFDGSFPLTRQQPAAVAEASRSEYIHVAARTYFNFA